MTNNPVIASLANPTQLEKMYHANPGPFVEQLYAALAHHPDAQILKFWQTRIEFADLQKQSTPDLTQHLMRLLLICAGAWLFMKLPAIAAIDLTWYYTRFAPIITVGALILFHATRYAPPLRIVQALLAIVVATLGTMLLLPNTENASVVMAMLHAPLVMWSALGLTWTASNWQDSNTRLDYFRYNGELFIYTVLIGLGGMVLTGITLGLFNLLNLDIEEWYFGNIAIAGAVSAPVVATFVYDVLLQRRSHLATLIANIFTPLFLVMITSYLLAMLVQQRSPYTDRDFLILFNGLLLLVLAMTIFSIAGRKNQAPSKIIDSVNVALVVVTLLVNLIALSAILYRLSEWGLTPNRVVVTGANLLIFVHLLWISRGYWRVLWYKSGTQELTRAITGMLPVYALWAVLVMSVLPVIFQFQ